MSETELETPLLICQNGLGVLLYDLSKLEVMSDVKPK